MKKKVIFVPKGQIPLEFLVKMERSFKSWVFLHQNVMSELRKTANNITEINANIFKHDWYATNDTPEINLKTRNGFIRGAWVEICCIRVDGTPIMISADDPEDIYFLKMEE
ncbi:MAG: hypothetical protein J6K42_01440 [Clostridia bacterium]|nr:hypothetical protein [Clostridia bacterium]